MSGRGRVLLAALALSQLVVHCGAQNSTFQWTFGNNFILTELQECQTLPIVVSARPANPSSSGVPPYYMLAFELGGVPTTTVLGTDPSKLSWTVNHQRGSALMLAVVDSTGNTGGIPPSLYNMTAGTSTSCLTPPPQPPAIASIKPNVTALISTCQPWGLTISGGTKPYQVVLAAMNSPVITNVSMGPEDDVFTFIDRADPKGLLMANVVDATGQWGVSSNVIPTTGSTDVDCVGLVSSSKTTQEIQQEAIDQAAAEAAAARHRRNMRILAIVLGICLPLLFVGLGVAYWWYRRRVILMDRDRGVWDGQDVTARVWELPPGGGEMVQHSAGSDVQQSLLDHKRSMSGPESSVLDTPAGSIPMRSLPSPTYADFTPGWEGRSGPSSSTSQSDTTRPTGTGLSGLSPRQRKALEAQGLTPSSSSTHLPPGALPPAMPGGPRTPRVMDPADSLDHANGPDIIIQHRDAGAGPVVQELPPPYMNRFTAQPPPPAEGSSSS